MHAFKKGLFNSPEVPAPMSMFGYPAYLGVAFVYLYSLTPYDRTKYIIMLVSLVPLISILYRVRAAQAVRRGKSDTSLVTVGN
jgi:hypothetical protein